jgi:AraC family transcriptional regulator
MTKAALEHYQARMRRVLDHIEQHLDDDLGLDALSGVAAFSKHHFHRQFSACFGLSLHRYVQLVRLKRASYLLAFRDGLSVTEIALDAGYEAPESFARSFRQRFGQPPSDFRKAPDWESWIAAFEPLDSARSKLMQSDFSFDDISIQNVPNTHVAVMPHRGDPRAINATIQRFISWRKANGLSPRTNATYNIFHSDPRTTAPEDYRLDLCVGVDRALASAAYGVESAAIPGGRCAVLRVIGSSDDLEPAAQFLYREWLPQSGQELRDFPVYCQRISFFPDVPECETVTDLFLPIH